MSWRRYSSPKCISNRQKAKKGTNRTSSRKSRRGIDLKDSNLTTHMRMDADGNGTKAERPTLRSKSRGKDRDPIRAGKSMKFMNRVGMLREFSGDADTEDV